MYSTMIKVMKQAGLRLKYTVGIFASYCLQQLNITYYSNSACFGTFYHGTICCVYLILKIPNFSYTCL